MGEKKKTKRWGYTNWTTSNYRTPILGEIAKSILGKFLVRVTGEKGDLKD